jgi:hypothetical protein
MIEHTLLLSYGRLLQNLSAHPIGKTLERKTKEWKETPSIQYRDIRCQYSDYNKINTKMIFIIINTITPPPQSKSKTLMNNFKTFIKTKGIIHKV